MLFPFASRLVFLCNDVLHLLAKCCLFRQVFFFLLAQCFEMLLVTLVDDGRRSLKTCPNLFAQFFGYRSNFAVLLMQFLQLVEGTNYVFFVGKVLSRFTQLRLQLQVFLEIIFARFPIEVQQVVKLLNVQLVVAPQFASVLWGYGLNLFPLLL